ncbi:MAG: tyrosine-type recombinase/integrase [Hyphomicrobiaceae bacterium]|nr:MAG: tyrosine-type recombinase/integrase [Hyphomicrobiaceae bacterium]
MAHTPFTDIFLRKLKVPAEGRVEHYDGKIPGFGIRVAKSGTKTFFVLGRHRSGFKRVSLGRYPTLTLEKARRKAQDTLRDLADGIDPLEGKRAARQQQPDLFPAVADQFVANYCRRHNRESTAGETERLLKAVYVPAWTDKPVTEISKKDVQTLIEDIMEAGKPSAARHAFATIRKFFNWTVEQGLIEHSPCLTLKTPAKANSRDRVLSDEELGSILEACERQGWPFGPVVKLLALTAQRRGEVVGMAWDEIDLKAKLWTIPGVQTKNHRPHVVPLTEAAVAIIEGLPRISGSPFVFPARGYIDRPYSGYSKGKRELDALAGQHGWTLHDLRRTAATGMAKAGVPPHVVERLLNHVSGTFGGVAGVYNRFGYLDEMREALTKWEIHVEALLDGQAGKKEPIPVS